MHYTWLAVKYIRWDRVGNKPNTWVKATLQVLCFINFEHLFMNCSKHKVFFVNKNALLRSARLPPPFFSAELLPLSLASFRFDRSAFFIILRSLIFSWFNLTASNFLCLFWRRPAKSIKRHVSYWKISHLSMTFIYRCFSFRISHELNEFSCVLKISFHKWWFGKLLWYFLTVFENTYFARHQVRRDHLKRHALTMNRG